jgi:competence protein ComEC
VTALLLAALVVCAQLPWTTDDPGLADVLPGCIAAAWLAGQLVRRERLTPLVCAAVVALVGLSIAAAITANHSGDSDRSRLLDDGDRSESPVLLRGEIASVSSQKGGGLRLRLTAVATALPNANADSASSASSSANDAPEPQWQPISSDISLTIRYVRGEWPVGRCIAVRSSLRRIRSFGNKGEFDWAAWNARRSTWMTAFAWNDDAIEDLGDCAGPIVRLRRSIAARAYEIGEGPGGVVAALITGDRSRIAGSDADLIRDAGTAHAMAISGLHLGLVTASVFAAVYWLCSLVPGWQATRDIRRPAAIVAAVAMLAYAALAGATPSVLRSVIMAGFGLAFVWWGRGSMVLPSLAAAAVVTALWMPGVLREAGFRLSYAATLGLVLWATRDRLKPGRLRSVVEISVLCQVVTLPLVAQDFHRVPLYAPLVNVLVAPAVTGATLLGLGAAALHSLRDGLGDWLFLGAAWCVRGWLAVANFAVGLPAAVLPVVAPGVWLVAFWELSVLGWLWPERRGRRLATCCGAMVVLLAVYGLWDRTRTDVLRVDVLSVGQGDATVVRLPGGAVMVVDAGYPGRGSLAVGPFLRRVGVATIDILIATHEDADHAGGLAELARAFKVGELWLPSASCSHREVMGAVAAVREQGGTVRSASQLPLQREFASGSALVTLLGSDRSTNTCGNNDSIVVRLDFAGRAILLPGDIEEPRERELLADSKWAELLRADVLKLPHHGSATSSTDAFLDAVTPRAAIASVGWKNRFGFPAATVVARLKRREVPIVRTDLAGSVAIRVGRDGSLAIQSARGGGLAPNGASRAAAGPAGAPAIRVR